MQFPAGTVEADETPEAAAVRVTTEETGLFDFGPAVSAGELVETLAPPAWVTSATAPLLARPDGTVIRWAALEIRRGLQVTGQREENGYVQIAYEEVDRYPNSRYVTFGVTGRVNANILTRTRRRFFYLLPLTSDTPLSWDHTADGHTWTLFWRPIDDLPLIVAPQDAWVRYLRDAIK